MFERMLTVSPVVYIVNNFYKEIKLRIYRFFYHLTSNNWAKASFKK
jgi:hypothetical protein